MGGFTILQNYPIGRNLPGRAVAGILRGHPRISYFYGKARMQKVEHIGIAVKDLAFSIPLFERLLGSSCYKTERVDSEKVDTAFFRSGETKIELVQGLAEDSVITKHIARRGEGMHHIAFEVADIHAEMQRLAAEGFTLLNAEPKPGADNKLVCFLHPKDTGGVLIELCMDRG
jgi:methylmalonyl-CoA/ethylmalonyl-CoA epimerase